MLSTYKSILQPRIQVLYKKLTLYVKSVSFIKYREQIKKMIGVKQIFQRHGLQNWK